MVRVEDHCAFLDRVVGVRLVRADYAQAAIILLQGYFHYRGRWTQEKFRKLLSLCLCASVVNWFYGAKQQARARCRIRAIRRGFSAVLEVARSAGYRFRCKVRGPAARGNSTLA